jgi:hypothetical protein
MMRSLSGHQRSALRAIGPGLLLAIAACLPNAAFASEEAGASQRVCEIPYICDRDTNRGGSQTATGTSSDDSGGSASSPTGDTSSSPTGDSSSAPTGD